LAIVRADSLASGVTNRLAAGAPAVVPGGRGRPSIYMPLGSGADVLVAGPLPPPPLEPLLTTAVVFAFVLTFTVSAAVGIPLMRRLRRLRHAISELGGGNLSIRLDPDEGELSELAESINRMASQLQRQFQEREALLQAVSHEMGTPLSRMRFAIEFLEERASGEDTNKRMRALTADLDELDRLSSELVAWIETDGSGPRRRVFDLAPVLESLVELECQGSASAARVDLWAAPDLAIHADQRQFQRAIENLLRNALRYAQSRIVVQAERDGERVVVDVRDDGPGIAAEDRRRVLDPFVRLGTGDRSSHCGGPRGICRRGRGA
jgi:two-component system sensor histidine kinase RstB